MKRRKAAKEMARVIKQLTDRQFLDFVYGIHGILLFRWIRRLDPTKSQRDVVEWLEMEGDHHAG